MRFLYPELFAPSSTYPTLHVLPSQCVQHHGASETVPVSTVESAVKISVGKSDRSLSVINILRCAARRLNPLFLLGFLWGVFGEFCNLGINCGLAAGRAVIWVALLVSCARSALGRPGLELTRSLLSASRRRSSSCSKSTDDTLCWLKHTCFMLGCGLEGIVNFVCTPAIERCLRTPIRGSRSLSSQRRTISWRSRLLLKPPLNSLIGCSNFLRALVQHVFRGKRQCITIFFTLMTLSASLTLQELKRSDELRYQENQQVLFRVFSFGILLIISFGPIYCISYRFYLVLVWLLNKLSNWLGGLLASVDAVVVRLSQLLARYCSSPCKQARRRNRQPSERRQSHREILYWLVALLLVLACFKVRPPECIDSRKAQLLGEYFKDGRTMHALHVDLLPIESFGALISAAIWTWILYRNLVGLLAGWVYPFLAWLHPPTLRYTHAVSLSSREREILLHYSRSLNPSSGIQTLGTGIQQSSF